MPVQEIRRHSDSTPARPAISAATAEIAIVLCIFVVGTWAGVRAVQAFRAAGGAQEFYQSEFGPAVMLACGRGFHNPDLRAVPALASFLAQASNTFDCASLPAAIATTALKPFQSASGYLEFAAAMTWKITGVSWSRLVALNGALFGLVSALTYGVFRLALSRIFALLALVPALMWSPNVMLAAHLRDYAKGPFLLGIILIMGLLTADDTGRRRALILASLAGIVVGLGAGFRTDLMIALMPVVLTIGFLLPPAVSIRSRLLALAIFVASLAMVGLPVLRGYARGGNTGHVMLLGLAKEFDRTLRIQPSAYEFVGQYNDTMAFSIINGFAARAGGRPAGADLSTAEYDQIAAAYLRHLVGTFPADVVTRTLAAIRVVPRYFLDSSLEAPAWSQSAVLRTMYWFRGGVSVRLAPLAVPAVMAATFGIAMASPRAALLGILVIVVFAGGSAIQFHERHFYYLQFLPWLAFGVIAQGGLRGRALATGLTAFHVKRAVVVCVSIAGAAVAAIVLSRGVQAQSARRLLEQYASAPRTPLPVGRHVDGSNVTRLTLPEWTLPLPPDSSRVTTRFLAIEFRDARCRRSAVDLTMRYESIYPDADLSETVRISLHPDSAEPTFAFLTAFDRADESIRFRSIETAADGADCVATVFRVDGLERAPLLLNTVQSASWRSEALHQRLQ